MPFVVFSLVVIAAMVVALVSAQALVAQDSFRVAELADTADRLEADYGEMRLRVAELSSPERVAEGARRAGLVLPAQVEILRVRAVPSRDRARRDGPSHSRPEVTGP